MVYDKDFDVPLAAAQVSITETGEKVTTTDEGNFVFGQVPPGKYTLVFFKDGYTRQVEANVVVSAGQMTEVEAWLSGEFTEMEEFIVQDLQIAGTEAGLLMLRVASPALLDLVSSELLSQAGASDAASALKLIAGATVAEGKYAVIRGLPDRYVNSQMNNVRLPTADADKRAVQLDQFPSEMIESVQVSKTFLPDQQGDASGGAVNIVLKGIPDEKVFNIKAGTSYNSQATFNKNFLTYNNGGVDYFGVSDRVLPFGVEDAFEAIESPKPAAGAPPTQADFARYALRENQINSFSAIMGPSTETAPLNHNWGVTFGNKYSISGIKFGFLSSFNYSQNYSHYDNGQNDKRIGFPELQEFGYSGTDSEDRYELYDVTKSEASVLWGGLMSVGAQIENHQVNLTFMQTQTAEDETTLMEDTRAFFLGLTDANNFFRNETLKYQERSTSTMQLRGEHAFPIPQIGIIGFFEFLDPEVDWTLAWSEANLWEPDLRSLISKWTPDDPLETDGNGTWSQISSTGSYVGRRIFRNINEESDQVQVNNKYKFTNWSGEEGYVKLGLFRDEVKRTYEQDSYTYKHGPGITPYQTVTGTFRDSSLSSVFGNPDATGYDGTDFDASFPLFLRNHNEMPWQLIRSGEDADYDGKQEIDAWYWMADLPLMNWIKVTGGVRQENTLMTTSFRASDGEELYIFRWVGNVLEGSRFLEDEWSLADSRISQRDILPAGAMEITPMEGIKLRTAYSQTIARPTFKEISPILQIDYLGSDQFVGNNNLKLSALTNYDFRAEFYPVEGSFYSASYFYKRILLPIEYTTVAIAQDPYVQPFNFPDGKLSGFEFEARQELGQWLGWLKGLEFRVNATFIESEVTVPETLPDTTRTLGGFPIALGVEIPKKRVMKGAPEHLFNYSLSYEIPNTGTQLSAFYIFQGDTLIAGEGVVDGYAPNIWQKDTSELNFAISQKLGENWKLTIRAKNVLNPDIKTVYRSELIPGEVTKQTYTKGVESSISLTGKW